MKNLANGEYGEKVWEKKIKSQNEVGVIFGVVGSLKQIREDTLKLMRLFDKEIKPLIKKNAKVLDLGLGPLARFSVEFAKRGYNVTGVDISDTTLKYAKKNIDKAKAKIKLVKDDITELKNIKGKFDFVFCEATFYHVPPHLTSIALMKINHLLNKNGRFFVEFGIVTKKRAKDYIRQPFYWTGHYIKRLFGKGFKVNVSRFTFKEIKEMIEKSGFKIERRFNESTFLLKKD
jgi:2-polyprenyl-3-methyl-5-hydroxy-6-metoxy-1,4-benzoquinol methylase